MKANHNWSSKMLLPICTVANISKNRKMKANHNPKRVSKDVEFTVANISKNRKMKANHNRRRYLPQSAQLLQIYQRTGK